jgi:hypothetical protein
MVQGTFWGPCIPGGYWRPIAMIMMLTNTSRISYLSLKTTSLAVVKGDHTRATSTISHQTISAVCTSRITGSTTIKPSASTIQHTISGAIKTQSTPTDMPILCCYPTKTTLRTRIHTGMQG